MRTMRPLYCLIIVLITPLSMTANAARLGEPPVRMDRYSVLSPGPKNDQVDPLAVLIQINFPASVHTVEDAIDFVLPRSGYRLADLNAGDPALPNLLSQPLPQVHRQFGTITLRELLQTLAGKSWVLVEDPVHRELSFDLDEHYRSSAEKAK